MLERDVYSQKAFKEMSKYYVFCKINVDTQQAVAQQHGVEALPTLKLMRADGSVIKQQVGALPLPEMLNFMNSARGQ